MRFLPARSYDSLKAATRRLIERAGGPKHCTAVTRGRLESHFSEYGAAQAGDRFIAADQIADLEADVGEPILTRALADLHDCDLVPRSQAVTAKAPRLLDHVAAIGLETAALNAGMIAALSDGALSEPERASLAAAIDGQVADLQGLRAELGPRVRAVAK